MMPKIRQMAELLAGYLGMVEHPAVMMAVTVQNSAIRNYRVIWQSTMSRERPPHAKAVSMPGSILRVSEILLARTAVAWRS
jgi:hypothetical protein